MKFFYFKGLYLRASSGGRTFNVDAQSSLVIPTVGQIITNSVTFTLTDKYVGKFQYFYVYTGKNGSVSAPNEYTANIYDVQIEEGSTATPYEPYIGRSITIDLGQTVYGAKLYPLEGKLVVDRAKYIESGQANWIGGSTGNAWRWFADVLNPLATIPTSQSGLSKAMSDKFKATYTVWSDPQTTVGFLPRGTRLWIRFGADTELTTAQKVKEWFTANPTEFVYELAEPLTIQLTPQQVNSLLGVNNIWADTGDTSCEYRADTKLYIERLTAPDSADMIADANITSGKYFMVGNSLYKATANIASGGQITVGTNCIRKSLSEALNEINA